MMTEQPPSERTASSPPLIVAFTSPTNGIGRTGVVANLAWLLAAAGNRVAVADWGTEVPRVHDYLSPFHVADVPMREFLDEVVRPRRLGVPTSAHSTYDEELFPALVVRRCRMPDGVGRLDGVAPADSSSPVRGFAPEQGGLGEVERLRDAIRRSDHDFVLVDAPTNMSADTGSRMARLYDVVAVCFLPLNSAIRQAASIAGEVWDSARVGVRVLAVPLRFDQGDPARAEQNAATVNAAFDRLLSERPTVRRLWPLRRRTRPNSSTRQRWARRAGSRRRSGRWPVQRLGHAWQRHHRARKGRLCPRGLRGRRRPRRRRVPRWRRSGGLNPAERPVNYPS
ncbi:hypothetical protein ACQPYE_27170 [Actinosynnema sp. CA-299493]